MNNIMYLDDCDFENEDEMTGCFGPVIFICVFWLVILLCVLLGGCKSVKYVSVPYVHTDTLYINKMQRDSIWLHDSVHVVEKQSGDTVYLLRDRWHTKYIESTKHDTIYQSRVDSIGVPYPVEVQVEKPLSWWQKIRMRMGDTLAILAGIAIVIGFLKLRRIFMP